MFLKLPFAVSFSVLCIYIYTYISISHLCSIIYHLQLKNISGVAENYGGLYFFYIGLNSDLTILHYIYIYIYIKTSQKFNTLIQKNI